MTPEERTALLLRERLTGATADITAPPGVAGRAEIGGQRRLKRRRIAEGAVTAAAAVTAVLAVLVPLGLDERSRSEPAGPPDPAPATKTEGPTTGTDPFAWLYDRPVRGDLKDDAKYAARALQLWNEQTRRPEAKGTRLRAGDLSAVGRGEPRVVWAGTTSMGPAALVVEKVTFPRQDPQVTFQAGPGSIAGYVGVDRDGNPRLVDDDYWDSGSGAARGRDALAWFVDENRTVGVAIDLGAPLGRAQGWRYGDDAVRDRDWKALTFEDGAAVFDASGAFWETAVARLPYDRAYGQVRIAGTFEEQPVGRTLRWGDSSAPAPIQIKGGGVESWSGPQEPWTTFTQALDEQLLGAPYDVGLPTWTASARLPDGSDVVVADTSLDADESHVYAVLLKDGKTRVVHAGVVDEFGPLPVRVRLPDSLGTIVVRPQAMLGWRSSTSPVWHDVGFGAALVPGDAIAVRIAVDGEETQHVELSRG